MLHALLAQVVNNPSASAPPPPPSGHAFDFGNPADWEKLASHYLPAVVTVIVIFIIAIILAGVLSRLTTSALKRARLEETLAIFIGRMMRWGILLLALVVCMSKFGVDTTSIAALIAGIGFAIAMGFRGTLGNLAAGFMLMVFRPFKVGDAVKIDGELGKVAEIELFSTFIDTFDNRRIILANANVFGSKIENLTFHKTRRVDVNVGVSYEADLDETRRVLVEAVTRCPGRLDDPEPAVALLDMGDSAINWVVRCWSPTDDFWTVREALTREVKYALDNAGLEIPYPQMDVHFNRKA